jgi:hypothetical protein
MNSFLAWSLVRHFKTSPTRKRGVRNHQATTPRSRVLKLRSLVLDLGGGSVFVG